MTDWLRPLLLMFYAPARGMSEVRDRAALGKSALLAVLAHSIYEVAVQWPSFAAALARQEFLSILAAPVSAVGFLLLVALVFAPITILIANLFERRGSFGVTIRQEYAAFASTLFYAWAAASLIAIPLGLIAQANGLDAAAVETAAQRSQELQRSIPRDGQPVDPQIAAEVFNLLLVAGAAILVSPLVLFGLWAIIAVREAFRFSWFRSLAVVLISAVLMFPALYLLLRFLSFFGVIFTSPLLLLLMFFLLRGYFGEVMSAQRARASFKQNLEAATLNPADASAHYNLGLIYLQRGEVTEARQRFLRAVEIDADEVDAHYQLGRISRAQERLPDAIKYFEQVVARDDRHAQNEIWREIGATYLAAEQFADARDALERFLDRRQSDPEGLYLMGRALAGLGLNREAAESMRACIEAVKTAPAYKYRTDKRWLNEAQQFLRTQA